MDVHIAGLVSVRRGSERPATAAPDGARGRTAREEGASMGRDDLAPHDPAGLLRERHRHAFTLEAAGVAAWEWDAATDELTWSSNANAVLGLPPDAAIRTGRQLFALIRPDDRERLRAGLARLAEQGGRLHDEFGIEDTSACIEIEAGRAEGRRLRGMLRDVTDQRQAEQHSAVLASIIESSQDAIVTKTLDGVITSWNAAAERLFGYPADEAIGRHITLIIPPERHTEEVTILERIGRGERVEIYETVRVTRDGRRIDVSLSISPVRDRGGRIVGAAKIARDISDRKRTEAALREADRRKTEFLALLGHELRNPLAAMVNGIQVLRLAGVRDDRSRGVLALIERQAHQMTRLLDDLLDISRITRGKIQLVKERLDLVELVRRTVEDARLGHADRGISLHLDLAPGPLWIDGDAVRLSQVVGNLLHNAYKFTDRGGAITVSVGRDADPGRAALVVRDTGVGMTPETLRHVFEPFVQAGEAAGRGSGGLGLGLSLVKGLVELHGGTVAARSDGPGRGSELSVSLPLAPGSPEADAPDSEPAPGRRPRLRVLVVDDSEAVAEAFGLLIEMLGHEVRVVGDGPSALAVLPTFAPDVVISDLVMPGMSGLELAAAIHRRPERRGITLVAMSGHGQPEHRRQALEAGFDEHLVKPVDPSRLQAVLTAAEWRTP